MLSRWSAKQRKPNKMTENSITMKNVLSYYNFLYCADALTEKLTYTIIGYTLEYLKLAPPKAKTEYADSIRACIQLLKALQKNTNDIYEFKNILMQQTKWVLVLTAWFIAQSCDVKRIMANTDDKKDNMADVQYVLICNACKAVYQLKNIGSVERLDKEIEFI